MERAEPLNKVSSPPHRKAQMLSLRWRIRWSKLKKVASTFLMAVCSSRVLQKAKNVNKSAKISPTLLDFIKLKCILAIESQLQISLNLKILFIILSKNRRTKNVSHSSNSSQLKLIYLSEVVQQSKVSTIISLSYISKIFFTINNTIIWNLLFLYFKISSCVLENIFSNKTVNTVEPNKWMLQGFEAKNTWPPPCGMKYPCSISILAWMSFYQELWPIHKKYNSIWLSRPELIYIQS